MQRNYYTGPEVKFMAVLGLSYSGSQTLMLIRLTWRAGANTVSWVATPESLLEEVGEIHALAFLTG